MMLDGKRVDLPQLKDELITAGIDVPALGTAGDDLHTYDEDGAPTDLPPAAAAVLAAHTPPPLPDVPDFGNDVQTPQDFTAQAAEAVASLRAYIGAASPTQGQTVAVVKLLCRVGLYLIRRAL